MTEARRPLEVGLGPGLTLRSVHAPGDVLLLEVSDAEGRLHRLEACLAAADAPAGARVGELALSHRASEGDAHADVALESFATWAAGLEVPLRVALGRWLDARPPLGAPEEPGPPRARRARPQPASWTPTERLHAWREDAAAAIAAGVQLAGVPRCMGGAPAPSDQARPPVCRPCLDRASCSGGFDDALAPALADADAAAARLDETRASPAPARRWSDALRPRLSDDALVDVLALLGALGLADAGALEACGILRDAQPRAAEGASSWELSWKLDGLERVDGARAVLYRQSHEARAALRAFDALAGGRPPALSNLEEVCEGLPCHVGFASHKRGRSAKLYLQVDQLPDGLRAARAQAIASHLGVSLSSLHERALYCIGLTIRPDGRRRVRAYEVVGRGELPSDPLADDQGGRAWDLSPRAAPLPTAHFLHYEDAHLTAADLRDRLTGCQPHLEWLDSGLSASRARYYLNFVAHLRGGARTLYADVGPRPRSLLRR